MDHRLDEIMHRLEKLERMVSERSGQGRGSGGPREHGREGGWGQGPDRWTGPTRPPEPERRWDRGRGGERRGERESGWGDRGGPGEGGPGDGGFDEKRVVDLIVMHTTEQVGILLRNATDELRAATEGPDEQQIVDTIVRQMTDRTEEIVSRQLQKLGQALGWQPHGPGGQGGPPPPPPEGMSGPDHPR